MRLVSKFLMTVVLALLVTSGVTAQTWDLEVAVDNAPDWIDFQIATNPHTGAVALVYQQYEGRKYHLRFKERSVSGTWSEPETIAPPGRLDYRGVSFTYDPVTSEPTIAYLYFRDSDPIFARRGDGAGYWPGEIIGTDAYGTAVGMTIDSAGTPWVAYCGDGRKSQPMKVKHLTETGWELPAEILHLSCAHPRLAAGPDGVLGAFFRGQSDVGTAFDTVNYSHKNPGDSGWTHEFVAGSPEEPHAHIGLAFAPNGTAAVLYRNRFSDRRVLLGLRTGGTWNAKDIPLPPDVNDWRDVIYEGPLFTGSGELKVLVGSLNGVQLGHCSPDTNPIECTYEWILQEQSEGAPDLAFALDPITDLPYVAIRKWIDDGILWLAVPSPCTTSEQCDDGIDCTTDTCAAGTCEHEPLTGDPCGDGGWCVDGSCFEPECDVAAECDDFNECTDVECIGYACVVTDLEAGWPCIDDGDPCTVDACNGAGLCESVFDPEIPGCEPVGGLPGDACTSGADCISGLCHPKKGTCK